MNSSPFGSQGDTTAGSGCPKDFADALSRFSYSSSWTRPVREAEEVIKVNSKFPITPGGELEGHMAIAAGTAMRAIQKELRKLQESARRNFSPEAIAHAEQWLTDHPLR